MDKLDLIHDAITDTRDSVKEVSSKVNKIELETVRNSLNLEEHMRRTAANEDRIVLMESKFTFGWLVKNIAVSVGSLGTITAALAKLLGYL